MANYRHKPTATAVLARDRATLRALRDLPGYAPRRPEQTLDALNELEQELTLASDEVSRVGRAYAAARNRLAALSWQYHDHMVSARAEVVAQFGANSDAVAMVGLKRKSQRKRPGRRRRHTA